MKKIKLSFAFLLFCYSNSFSESIYISQLGLGLQDGTSPANSRSVFWLNSGVNWGVGVGNVSAGDTIRLTGIITDKISFFGSGTVGSPIVLLFEKNAKISAPIWAGYAISIVNKSYVIIDGGENGVIEATDNGTSLNNQSSNCSGVLFNTINWGEIKNLTIRNIYVRTPFSTDTRGGQVGIYVDGVNTKNISIHHNNISEVESGIAFAYRNGVKNISLFNNKISRMSNGIFLGDANINCTLDSLEIHHNDISEGYVWEGGNYHNDGIQVFSLKTGSFIANLRIHSNYIHGDMGLNTTGFCFLSGGDGTHILDALVYNNVFQADSSRAPANGFFTIKDVVGADIFNNTVISNGGSGIGVHLNSGSSQTTIVNNIFYKTTCGIYSSDRVLGSQIDTCDYNIYYGLNKNNMAMRSNTGFKTWQQWLSLGYDANSDTANPDLINLYELKNTSIAIDNGFNFSNLFDKDKRGIPRPVAGLWDIGAYEYVNCSIYKPNLGNDTMICSGQLVFLNAGVGYTSYSWSTGQTTQQVSINNSSSISVVVTNSFGCTVSDTIVVNVVTCTGLDERKQKYFFISPNPTKGVVYLNLEKNDEQLQVEIINTVGEKVKSFALNQQNSLIDISELQTGVYFFILTSGDARYVERIVKE